MPKNHHQSALLHMLGVASRARLYDIIDYVRLSTASTVQTGPFEGMLLPTEHSLYDGATDCNKLLGCFEKELHDALEKAIERQPEVVINVGSAEGFYAIGLAKRLPNATIYAFESDVELHDVCSFAAEKNGVNNRIHLRGHCGEEDLLELINRGKRTFIFMDCEGDEASLLTRKNIPSFSNCDLIVECHDFVDRTITPLLAQLLRIHHQVDVLKEGPRNPSAYRELQFLTSLDRWLAMCEFRPEVMSWLACWSESVFRTI